MVGGTESRIGIPLEARCRRIRPHRTDFRRFYETLERAATRLFLRVQLLAPRARVFTSSAKVPSQLDTLRARRSRPQTKANKERGRPTLSAYLPDLWRHL